jgi:hypothetical protein
MNTMLSETYLTEVDFWIAQAEKNEKAAAQAVYTTRLEERTEIARSLILESWSTEKIAKTTKLTAAEVEALRREMTAHAM